MAPAAVRGNAHRAPGIQTPDPPEPTAVTTTDSRDLVPLKDDEHLLEPFREACKPPSQWRIGPEAEKPGVFDATKMPIPYEGERSVRAILEMLQAKHGWVSEAEYEGGPIIALLRDGASVTLEPGGQLELSGAMATDIHQVCAEMRRHIREIGPLSRAMGITWLGVGFHPFAKRSDFAWVPKQRYGIMREYLPTRGGHALDMMLRTSTVQGNYDYESEADAMRKMRVGLALAPATTAMFANSPWYEGKPHGGLTYRGRVWLDVDPDRSGLLPFMWQAGAGFAQYVQWALDVPMFMFKRDGKKIVNTGQTFRSFWKDGFEGHRPTMDDWKTHLNTLFPEVRLKKTIEIRGADAQSTPMKCALPALWTGIFYDPKALAETEALVEGWTYEEVAALRERAWKDGLRTPFRGKPLAEVAQRVVEIAEGGLERRQCKNDKGRDERVHLARLRKLVEQGKTPADVLLEGMDQEPDPLAAMLKRSALDWEK
jgi:glutamate--cysteine ligase